MERITKRMIDQPGWVGCAHINDAVCIDRSGNCPGCPWEIAAWKRLADYEDTGYTPAGIDAIAEAARANTPPPRYVETDFYRNMVLDQVRAAGRSIALGAFYDLREPESVREQAARIGKGQGRVSQDIANSREEWAYWIGQLHLLDTIAQMQKCYGKSPSWHRHELFSDPYNFGKQRKLPETEHESSQAEPTEKGGCDCHDESE